MTGSTPLNLFLVKHESPGIRHELAESLLNLTRCRQLLVAMMPSNARSRAALKKSVPRPFIAWLNRIGPSFGTSRLKISLL